MKKNLFLLTLILIIGCLLWQLQLTHKKTYRIDVGHSISGHNMLSPTPLVLAKMVQIRANYFIEQDLFPTDSLLSTINVDPKGIIYGRDFVIKDYFSLLKSDSSNYEILFYFPKIDNSIFGKDYYLCTPQKVYKIDLLEIENEHQIIKAFEEK